MNSGRMQLVFAPRERPGVAAVRRAAVRSTRMAISHDPAASEAVAPAVPPWLELLIDGQTFDLSGLAPGPGDALCEVRTQLEAPPGVEASREALTLIAGPHLAAGANMLPVVRAQTALMTELLRLFQGAQAVSWAPARALTGRAAFLRLADAWLAGGPFPALALVAFRETFGGDFQTEGLAFFTGQELHFDHAEFADGAAASRLAVRLVNDLVGRPALGGSETIVLADGSRCIAAPSRNGRFLRISHG